MKEHKGMRPHDILILLKIAAYKDQPWLMKDLAYELEISASEISESLNRSCIARLISDDKKTLMRTTLLEFLEHGLPFAFPQRPGRLSRGMPTAYSAPPLNEEIHSEIPIVWPFEEGNVRGEAIEPLYPTVPRACERDSKLYELLALCDALRIGRSREKNLAIKELKMRLK